MDCMKSHASSRRILVPGAGLYASLGGKFSVATVLVWVRGWHSVQPCLARAVATRSVLFWGASVCGRACRSGMVEEPFWSRIQKSSDEAPLKGW